MGKYKIYHIPKFVYPSGSLGKIGLTVQDVESRMKGNLNMSVKPFDFWEVLEEHDCITKASDREIELQKQYGYKVDTVRYEDFMKNRSTKGTPGHIASKEQRKRMSESAKKRKFHGNSRLTKEEVLYIREQYKTGKYSQRKLGDVFGLTQTGISRIIKKQTWPNI